MSNKRLYRSKTDRMIGGVCGGLGAYLGVDPVIFRILFVVLLFGADFGFLLYLLLWIVIPEEGKEYSQGGEGFGERVQGMGDDVQEAFSKPHPQAGLIIGGSLIIVGGVLLLKNLNIPWLFWMDFDLLWPVLLIIVGIALLVRRGRE